MTLWHLELHPMILPRLDIDIAIQRFQVGPFHAGPAEIRRGVGYGLRHAVALKPYQIAKLVLDLCKVKIPC
jgi:hypothetical protein